MHLHCWWDDYEAALLLTVAILRRESGGTGPKEGAPFPKGRAGEESKGCSWAVLPLRSQHARLIAWLYGLP